MVSITRPTRRSSRISSPHTRSPQPTVAPKKERTRNLLEEWATSKSSPPAAAAGPMTRSVSTASDPASGTPTVWTEPPVMNRPSYEDHGMERQGVLTNMAPLGSRPSAKLKAKLNAEADKGLTVAPEERGESSEPAQVTAQPKVVSQRAEKGEVKNQAIKPEEDTDYQPDKTKKMPSRSRASLSQGPTDSTYNGHRLEIIVDAAVKKAMDMGNQHLGLAVRQVYLESLHDQSIRDLLDSILCQNPTSEQRAQFHSYIRKAKKQIASGNIPNVPSLAGTSKNHEEQPATNDTHQRKSVFQRSHSKEKTTKRNRHPNSHPPQSHHMIFENSNSNPSKDRGKMNGTGSVQGTQKRSRSDSTSSISSLTSIDSVEEDTSRKMRSTALRSDAKSKEPDILMGPKKVQAIHNTMAGSKVSQAKRSSTAAGLSEEESEAVEMKRRKLKQSQTFDNLQVRDSSIRKPLQAFEKTLKKINLKSTSTPKPNGVTRLLSSQERRDTLSDASDASARSAILSQPGTPQGLERPAKKAKPAAKVKMSPVKKKTGVIAGLARGSGAKASPIGYDDNEVSDNNDFCSACGGNGFLLCCDGCDRSFHLTCCDPPLSHDASTLDEPWFCYACTAKRKTPQTHSRGLFSGLFAVLDKSNPSSFCLPKDIKNYFEGIKTGPYGQYEDLDAQKPSKNRSGYDELPDFTRLKDSKGNLIFCSHCGGSSLSKQQIIACDYCTCQFHLDCLDPPQANPPPLRDDGKRSLWMCPRHIEHDLKTIDPRQHTAVRGRIHRIRKPRVPKVKDVSLRRGFKNNGLIEIDNDASDTDSEFYEDESASGTIYRLPEKGVILDFIYKVKETKMRQRLDIGSDSLASTSREAVQQLQDRSVADQSAALSLALLAQQDPQLGLKPDRVGLLVHSLIAEMPENAAAEVVAAQKDKLEGPSTRLTPPSSDAKELPLNEEERKELLLLQKLIERRLGRV